LKNKINISKQFYFITWQKSASTAPYKRIDLTSLPGAILTLLIESPLTIPQLSNKISKILYKNKISKEEISKILYKITDKLEKEGLIIKEKIGKYTFLYITFKGLIWLPKVDLRM